MDTYSLTFTSRYITEPEFQTFFDFIKQRSELKQALWLSRMLIILPNSQEALDEIKQHPYVDSMEQFASGNSYSNKWAVVFDSPLDDSYRRRASLILSFRRSEKTEIYSAITTIFTPFFEA